MLYSLPPDEWWMASILPTARESLSRRRGGLCAIKHGVSIHFAGGGMDECCATVLAHESAITYATKRPRVTANAARTVDEEAVADLHARRTRARFSSR